MSRILNVEQAAEKLGMTPKLVREHFRRGRLPGRKLGKSWRILESDLEAWISTGKSNQSRQFVSARGLLKSYPGKLSSADVIADKRREVEIEEAKFQSRCARVRKSA
jgi:excisionase family DNA binding protein